MTPHTLVLIYVDELENLKFLMPSKYLLTTWREVHTKSERMWWTPKSGWDGNTYADSGMGTVGTGQTAARKTFENRITTPYRGTVELGHINKGRYRSGNRDRGGMSLGFPYRTVSVPITFSRAGVYRAHP